ncbi:MAG TPA: hypothetical protein ENL12_02685 [Dehalococcoidia bacterium]|nr:hypothetical protein [Dehalococcoidia bacterium]
MTEEHKGRNTFEGYHITEDDEIEKALQEYKAADERLWDLTSRYLYPPEDVPHQGTRELVFPNVAARDEFYEARRLARETQERYEAVAKQKQTSPAERPAGDSDA